MILVHFVIILLVLIAIFNGLSSFEKRFLVIQKHLSYEVIDSKSLLWFKRIRIVNNIVAAIEIVTNGIPELPWLIVGTILIFSGTYFRIEAIRSLAQFWNFNVVRYRMQPVITAGVYKYFSHPSYMGNMAIVGVYLFFGAIFSSAIAMVWLIIFATYRILIERNHALCR